MLQRMGNFFDKSPLHDIIECLIAALEAKDVYTGGHSSRVADMTLDIAKVMGLRGSELDIIHMAAHLHDIGKIGVPQNILEKKGKLLPHEWAQIQMHPEIGYNILSKSKRLQKIAQIVLYHHERWDGKGYPHGLKADSIPLGARIIAVADAIDAMTSMRPYRMAMPWEICIEEVRHCSGIQFDPVIVEAVEKLWKKWIKTYCEAACCGS